MIGRPLARYAGRIMKRSSRMPVYVSVIVALLVTAPTATGRGQARVFAPGEAPLFTTVQLPDDYDPGRVYPLVLALHGYGGSEKTFDFLAPTFRRNGMILAAARGPYEFFAEGAMRHEWLRRSDGDEQAMAAAARQSVEAIRTLADELAEAYPVSRTFLFGFSQGGTLAFLAGLGSERFAGIVTFGSRLAPERVDEASLRERPFPPVYIAHGLSDRIPMSEVIAGRDLLRRLGFSVTFRSFTGAHEIPPPEAQLAIEWMLAQGRDRGGR